MGPWLCLLFEGASELLPKDASGMEMNPPEFIDVPAGTYIYGHRSLMPRRFERTEETKTKEIERRRGGVERHRFSKEAGRKSLAAGVDERHRFSKESINNTNRGQIYGRKSLDGEISGRPWMKANRELDSAGSSRKNSIDQQHKPGPNLSAAAKPFDISKNSIDQQHKPIRFPSTTRTAPKEDDHEEGTEEEHRQAEAVAVKAAQAALKRVASGANMRGMVRMGSTHTMSLLDNTPISRRSEEGARADGFTENAQSTQSFGFDFRYGQGCQLRGVWQHRFVERLTTRRQAGERRRKRRRRKLEEKRNASWVDLSMLVISGNGDGGNGSKEGD